MQTNIRKIYEVDNLGTTPARVNRETGELYINTPVWAKIPKAQRMFILLHEAGHTDLQTTNEMAADQYAFSHYADLGYPLSQSVKALTQVLPFDRPGHFVRAKAQLNRALIYDQKNQDNMSYKHPQQKYFDKSFGFDSEFLGIKSKAKKDLGKQQAANRELEAKLFLAENEKKELVNTKVATIENKDQSKQLYIAAGVLAVGLIIFLIMKKK